jgi:hypothetical protein
VYFNLLINQWYCFDTFACFRIPCISLKFQEPTWTCMVSYYHLRSNVTPRRENRLIVYKFCSKRFEWTTWRFTCKTTMTINAKMIMPSSLLQVLTGCFRLVIATENKQCEHNLLTACERMFADLSQLVRFYVWTSTKVLLLHIINNRIWTSL